MIFYRYALADSEFRKYGVGRMPAKKQAAASKGKRYTEQEKTEILAFVEAQGRGGASAAAKKFNVSPLTISSWRKAAGTGTTRTKSGSAIVEKDDVLRALAQKGFKVVRMVNALTGEMIEEKIDPKVEKLGLDFAGLKSKADDAKTYVVQSSGQILVTMTLDRLLAVTSTKP
jgi:transposase-like protein